MPLPATLRSLLAVAALLPLAASAQQPTYQPAQHQFGAPLVDRASPQELALLADQGVAIEHDRRHVPPLALGVLAQTDQRRYGDTLLSFFTLAAPPHP